MQLKTILNCVHRQPGFVYGRVAWFTEGEHLALRVEVRPHGRSRGRCSKCLKKRPGYDTLSPRQFTFVPLWGILVYLVYAMRRVDCPRCGVVVEAVPWADGKQRVTKAYAWFLAGWAKRLSWKEVAAAFHTSWDTVFRSVEMAVEWGLARRNIEGVTAIGIDEVLWQRGYKFLTVVYQIDSGARRLLWVGKDRTEATLLRFFRKFGKRRSARLSFICSDMWKPYLNIIARMAAKAVHVLDRFHVAANMSKAIDQVRAAEARELKRRGHEPVLKHTRFCLLKRPENLTDKQEVTLATLLKLNLRTVRAYLLKEDFRWFWGYTSPYFAGKFLDRWVTRALRSRIEPMQKIARSLRSHRPLLLNWFCARGTIALGAVEGLNNKLKVITRRAYGFRSFRKAEIALYHALGALPEPDSAHKFC
jgi:transposase